MTRLTVALFLSLSLLAGCVDAPGTNGPGPGVFRIGAFEKNRIPYRVLDSVNAFRQASGLAPLELSAELTAAAATHSRDMSVQNRPWHFGSDGSSPIERIARAGYKGPLIGENISETFESDVETLAAWMAEDGTRAIILDKNARYMGLAWYQEANGKIWWTQIIGG
jgi:uncharacterized protein YkwD